MDIKEIFDFQKKFDEKHGWEWTVDDEKGMLERLKYVTIAINGEAGEMANFVKKALRENFPEGKSIDAERLQKVKEEIVDIFIYVMLACRTLKMDLEEEYFKKMRHNDEKYKNLEK
jgi:NTP pyrophosphatase (non-canonical NTP hydrolase)